MYIPKLSGTSEQYEVAIQDRTRWMPEDLQCEWPQRAESARRRRPEGREGVLPSEQLQATT